MADDVTPIRRALISVSDKTGLVDFAQGLHDRGAELISTGGTAAKLRSHGLPVTDVSDVTGFPEILDGRVKTLHPAIHGAILGRPGLDRHKNQMDQHGFAPIDLVAINLYPFESVVAGGAGFDAAIENIDIGGPAMIRAAAKNHGRVTVAVSATAYPRILEALDAQGGVPATLRRELAATAFNRTAAYDGAIGNWFAGQLSPDGYPEQLNLSLTRRQGLRYGENPHQGAAFYSGAMTPGEGRRPGVATAEQLQGKALSYNNINDTDAAYELAAEFDDPAAVVVKHANPAGAAVGRDTAAALRSARACDPTSAFGGIVAVNRPLDGATAEVVAELFTEVVIAPDISAEAREALAKKTNLRLLAAGGLPEPGQPGRQIRSVAGGALLQDRDSGRIASGDLSYPTQRQPSARELADMLFAFTVCKHVRSNAIVYARGGATVGIGAGQMSRVDACRMGAQKAAEAAEAAGESASWAVGSVVASDAFVPFPDGLIVAAEAGATAVIQPGGGKRDQEIVAACDAREVAMAFTGMRHFRH